MNFFHHKDLGNHLLQLCPKVVKHPVYIYMCVCVCVCVCVRARARAFSLLDLILCYNVQSSSLPFIKHLLIAQTKYTMLIHYIHLLCFSYIRFGVAFTNFVENFCALFLKLHVVRQLLHYGFYSNNQ